MTFLCKYDQTLHIYTQRVILYTPICCQQNLIAKRQTHTQRRVHTHTHIHTCARAHACALSRTHTSKKPESFKRKETNIFVQACAHTHAHTRTRSFFLIYWQKASRIPAYRGRHIRMRMRAHKRIYTHASTRSLFPSHTGRS